MLTVENLDVIRTAAAAAHDKKAFQMVCLEVSELTSYADSFLLCSAGSFILVIVLATRRIVIGPEEGGLFTLFGCVFFLLSICMVGIGLIGEYVGRTYQAVRRRARYHIKEILEVHE